MVASTIYDEQQCQELEEATLISISHFEFCSKSGTLSLSDYFPSASGESGKSVCYLDNTQALSPRYTLIAPVPSFCDPRTESLGEFSPRVPRMAGDPGHCPNSTFPHSSITLYYCTDKSSRLARHQIAHFTIMGAFNRGFAQSLHGSWLQAGITICSAWAFTLFGQSTTIRRKKGSC